MLRISTVHRLARLSSVSALLLCSVLTFAQAPAARIRGPIELNPSVPLEGSLNPHVRISDDLGPLAPDTPIRGITLVFKRSAAQEADLQQLLAQQTDPSSSLFHHWLTPADFAARFGIADADIVATKSWLQSHGFTIDDLPANRDRITFSGTAAQVKQAFGAELHRFRSSTGTEPELHFAPASELALPPALAPLTAAVLHLSDFRPKPNIRPHPNYTTVSTQQHFLVPKDIAVMYDLSPLLSNNYIGSGQSIAVVGQSFIHTGVNSAVWNFAANLTGSVGLTPVLVPNTGVEAIYQGDEGESDIDVEYSGGNAINSTIFFVHTGSSPTADVNDAIAYAITMDIAPIITISYSECEPLLTPADVQQYNALYEQAAAQGQSIVAASGDDGATACARYGSGSGLSTQQQQALAVGFPASSPYVTAVGGTQMAPGTFAAGASSYWAPPLTTTLDVTQSLLSYVPEVVWNEDSSARGLLASGGGVSSIFARPSWQNGVPGIPSGSFRLVPDIAMQASIASPGYLVCSEDSSLSGATSDCQDGLVNSNNTYALNGGTSFGAPILAGFLAILNQYEHTTGLGNINPVLYNLAAQPSSYASLFHDITSGTSACLSGDGNCAAPGQNNYTSTTGYDLATGLGSIDFGKLAAAWPSTPSNLTPTNVLFIPGSYAIPTGAADPITISVGSTYNPAGTTSPTGTVALYLDGQLVNPTLALTPSANSSSVASYTFLATSTTGTHIIAVRYPGDSAHLPSFGTFALPVGSLVASGSFLLSANNLTLSSNSSSSTALTITPSGGYNGALSWTVTLTGGTVATTYCYLAAAPTINGTTTGTLYFGVGSACNSLSSLHVVSPVQRSSITSPPASHAARLPAAAVLALLLFGLRPSRRKLLPLLSLLVLATIPFAISGCGSGGGSSGGGGGGSTGPQPQVYTVTLKATDSVNTAITASTSFTLTVNP